MALNDKMQNKVSIEGREGGRERKDFANACPGLTLAYAKPSNYLDRRKYNFLTKLEVRGVQR